MEAMATPSYSQIVAFGDSYSDSGNIGRSTEAENWLEYLAADLSLPGGLLPSSEGGTNYSMASARTLGSGSLDLEAQMSRFMRLNSVADPNALYVIWTGFNDIADSSDVTDIQLFADEIAGGVVAAVESIRGLGGQHFLIPNAWDRTTTPVSRLFHTPEVRDKQFALHLLFNESLGAMLDSFPESAHYLDVFGLSGEISDDPARFGFTKGQTMCPVDTSICDGYIWRDFIHPTSSSHRILADRALEAIPEPSSALLLATGLLGLAARRSRADRWRVAGARGAGASSFVNITNTACAALTKNT